MPKGLVYLSFGYAPVLCLKDPKGIRHLLIVVGECLNKPFDPSWSNMADIAGTKSSIPRLPLPIGKARWPSHGETGGK